MSIDRLRLIVNRVLDLRLAPNLRQQGPVGSGSGWCSISNAGFIFSMSSEK
jgi:hypothetical protein